MFVIDTKCNGNRVEVFELANKTFLIAVNDQIVNRGLSAIDTMQWLGDAMINLKSPVANEANVKYIISIILSGKKIEAIKEYRTATGFGLKESKDAVERVEQALRSNPEWFNANMEVW